MGKLGGEASIRIDAHIDQVWAVVEDVPDAPNWQGGLTRMEVLERDDSGRAIVCNSMSDIKVRTVTTRVRFTYRPPNVLQWEQVKGDLKSLVGAWHLEEVGSGVTSATYRLEGDPGRMLGMLIRGPVEERIRHVLVEARPGELKTRVEGM